MSTMVVRCPTCNEWMTATESGAICAAGHGGVFGGVRQRDIDAAKKSVDEERRREKCRQLLTTTPKAHVISSPYWRIEGVSGIFLIGHRCTIDAEPKNGEIVAFYGVSTCYRFVRNVKFEEEVRAALGLSSDSPTGEAKG